MASSLLYLVFFVIFLVILYYFMYKPTNKLQLLVNKINNENNIIKERNEKVPKFIDTSIFLSSDKPTETKANLYYDSASGIFTLLSDSKKYIFRLDTDEDVRSLLPILLLSK
ncbi:MV entry-fusion complex protein [Brazilian porcupinepox virus 1]|nr:MV entry-fusion complex protein [Brazilian porcupinepox virus 1]